MTARASVAAAINAQYGNLVDATVVNVGTRRQPRRPHLAPSATLGPMTVDIQKPAGTSLQTQGTTPGRLASYEVDDSGKRRDQRFPDGHGLRRSAS